MVDWWTPVVGVFYFWLNTLYTPEVAICLLADMVNLCDQVTRQIQSTLGNYEEVKHLLGSAHDSIYGIDGHPPPSPAPATTRTPVSRSTTTPPVSRSAVLTSGGGPEFKKPTRSSMPTSSSSSSNNNHRDHHHPSSTQR
ncbi:hypothetical protein M8J77_017495 [Diaphorina citri]|nr:hypothetical protein M8J77_017495 [Diaphorina citri]